MCIRDRYYDYSGSSYVYTPGYWTSHDRIPTCYTVRDHRDGRPTVVVPPVGGGGYRPPGGGDAGGSYHRPPDSGRIPVPSPQNPNPPGRPDTGVYHPPPTNG